MRNRHIVLVGLVLLYLGVSPSVSPAGIPRKSKLKLDKISAILEARTGRRFVPGEILVKHRAGITARLTAEQAQPFQLQATGRVASGGETVYRISSNVMGVLSAKSQRDRTMAAVKGLQAMPDVQYAQPNYIYRIQETTPNDQRYGEQWHYFKNGSGAGNSPGGIGLPVAWDTTQGSDAVVVAVIDTGILPKHPDIIGSPNLVAGYDMISEQSMADDGDGRDPDPTDPGDAVAKGECGGDWPPTPQPSSWHGTHVAGTIGVGNTNNRVGVAGINWNVKVQPIRVLGKCGGTTSDIADAIRWAAGLPVPGVPNNLTKARVINMSLGGEGACSDDAVTQSAINDAVAAGVTVVVAAGNSAEDASLSTPAGCDNVIAVAASDARGYLVTRYSNYGPTVKILAPGGDVQRDDNGDGNPDGVLSMVSPDDGTYAYYNGTSMASPHVAGVAALVLAREPALTPPQVLARLQATAIPRSLEQCPKPCGAGLLNAAAALGAPLVAWGMPDLTLGKSAAKVTTWIFEGGTGKAGQTVTFSSDDVSVATVSPENVVSDGKGGAAVTVQPHQKGTTHIHASTGAVHADSQVVVAPSLSSWVLIVLFIAAVTAYVWKLRQENRISRMQNAAVHH